LAIDVEPTGLKKIASCARQTPRVANRLLKRVRDFAQINEHDIVDNIVAQKRWI